LKIPKSIKLRSRVIITKFIKDLYEIRELKGEADFDTNTILLATDKKLPITVKEIAYCHEWLHLALTQNGFDDISSNEKFVEIMSECIHELIMQVGK